MRKAHLCMLCLLSLVSSCSAFGYRRLCGTQLVEALLFVCGERGLFYQPGRRIRNGQRVKMQNSDPYLQEGLLQIPEGVRERKSSGGFMKRGIVEQCCNFYCNNYDLENYCNT